MTFVCDGCLQERSFDTDYGMCRVMEKKGFQRICRLCRSPRVAVPDVYWDGKPEEGLADDPVTGKPRVFLSKGQKAAYLRERGLMEAGDRVHGAPPSITEQEDRRNTREEVREALQKVKQMGRDYRRREYLRIINEGRRYA